MARDRLLVVTDITNGRTEAANTTIQYYKRTGRGFRNPAKYKTRIPLTSRRPEDAA